jgi:hypothetical protein
VNVKDTKKRNVGITMLPRHESKIERKRKKRSKRNKRPGRKRMLQRKRMALPLRRQLMEEVEEVYLIKEPLRNYHPKQS